MQKSLPAQAAHCLGSSAQQCVVGAAWYTGDKSNPRFIVTALSMQGLTPRAQNDDSRCTRGEAENRIQESKIDLCARRLSAATLGGNQMHLW